MPVRAELNSLPLLEHALAMQKKCYLPILHPLNKNILYFCQYEKGDLLIPNRYGILEPKLNLKKLIPSWALDCVLVPLVGFDNNYNRLGMGGGFYDRSFAFKKTRYSTRPCLIGLAYSFQKLNTLKPQPWDVALNFVVTD
jgi:5-formyltetrahydrofolate cyclo-ligase